MTAGRPRPRPAAGPTAPLRSSTPSSARGFSRPWARPPRCRQRAWPVIARGAHVLVSAPTGTGQDARRVPLGHQPACHRAPWPPGKVRILYVSPAEGAEQRHPAQPPRAPGSSWPTVFREAGQALPRDPRAHAQRRHPVRASGSGCCATRPRSSSPRRRASTSSSPRRTAA